MDRNPFTPPEAPLREQPPAPAAGSPVKAVLVGLAVDLGGSMLIGIVLSAIYAGSLASQGMSEKDVMEAMTHVAPSSWVAILGTLLGAGMSFLGGYVCARIARRDEYRLASIVAALSVLFGLVMGWDSEAVALNLLFALTTVACVLLGAKYGRPR